MSKILRDLQTCFFKKGDRKIRHRRVGVVTFDVKKEAHVYSDVMMDIDVSVKIGISGHCLKKDIKNFENNAYHRIKRAIYDEFYNRFSELELAYLEGRENDVEMLFRDIWRMID